MAVQLQSAWSQVRHHPARVVAVVAAIVLGIGFASGSLVFAATFQAHLERVVSAQASTADVVIKAGDNGSNNDDPARSLDAIRATAGVRHAEPLATVWLDYAAPTSHGTLRIDTLPTDPGLRWFGLTSGRWPTATDEIVLDEPTAAGANLAVGSSLSLTEDPSPDQTTVTVVGVVDTSSSTLTGAESRAFAPFALLSAINAPLADQVGALSTQVLVLAEAGRGANELADRLAAAFPALAVSTGAEQAASDVAKLDGEGDTLTVVLAAFAAIAVLVAGIVVANTFAILLAQRRRQVALVRCVGAGRGQVRNQVLLEALLLGAVGSALGVLTGAGIGVAAATVTGLDAGGFAFDLPRQAVVFAVGVLVTVLAAWWPARRAMRIAPLAALQPVADSTEQRRSTRARTLAGGLLLLAGLVGLGYGVTSFGLPVAMLGGALSAVGVLVLTPLFVPTLLRAVGALALRLAGALPGSAGVSTRLATANMGRNPSRSASATAALMVGVGLIVTLQVGASSAAATLDREVSKRYPVDVAVAASSGALPAGLAERIAAVDGVVDSTVILGTRATAADVGRYGPHSAQDGGFSLLGVPPQAALRGGTDGLNDDTLLVPSWWIGDVLQVGQRLTVKVGDRAATFVVAVGPMAAAGPDGSAAVTTAAALARLAPQAPGVAVWAGLRSDADLTRVTSTLNEVIAPYRQLELTGAAGARGATADTLATVVTLATGMLAVAVLIAVLGIGNTLGLSVIERRRESALLRALGLSRRGLLRTLLLEAVLLAGVGGLIGAVLGIGYGWAGTTAAVGSPRGGAALVVPWGTVAGVLILVVLAGVAAALVPAGRAARVSPATALAAE